MIKKLLLPLLQRIPYWEKIFEYSKGKRPLGQMTALQESFCEWNAERLHISIAESKERYRRSWNVIRGGHRGGAFRTYTELTHNIFGVFFDDRESEVFVSYQYYGYLDFLRLLSYAELPWKGDDRIVQEVKQQPSPVIVDFGCGLAQRSIELARKLQSQGCKPTLVLCDIPTIRKEFLIWLCEREQLSMTFLSCTPEQPIPDLPRCHICIATEVFEHLHDPLPYFNALHAALEPGGYFITQISDHHQELFHVTPNLGQVRQSFAEHAYTEHVPHILFQKTH